MIERQAHPRRRAFAVIFALFLLALVGAALLALTSLMTTDARRSTRAATDAQVRQLLHAGAVAAAQRLRGDGTIPPAFAEVTLPPSLGGNAARLTLVAVAKADGAVVTVEARIDDRAARQRVLFRSSERGWNVAEVESE